MRNMQKNPQPTEGLSSALLRCCRLTVIAFLLVGIAATADAQSKKKSGFIPLGRIPQLIQPGGAAPARFFSRTTRVLFYVNADSLDQNISQNLSLACALGRFNQKKVGRYYVLIETEDGKRKRLGFASSEGFNLRDPDDRKGRDLAFLFEYDGTSECRVHAVPTLF
ncbi:MAG: hypothetical protein RIM72_01495 [Alphaproteobacteria bacterium]